MSKKSVTTYRIDKSVAQVAEQLRSAQFARARLGAAQRDDARLITHEVDGDRVRVEWTSRTPVAALPGWMQARYRTQGPEGVRHEDWTFDGTSLRGSIVFDSPTAGGSVSGTQTIEPDGDGCTWTIDLVSAYPVPVIGSKIEKFSLQALTNAMAAEADCFSSAA